ncbi:hypothetical protein TREMEDRAFT_60625 [Tremella mesenterica DSM 1558]|uniref:uncharacterized protein n=1 Tax=Tremella mesenterica (strain ATCC 24925 / CBS 8224 / DSM 1558 / NBRC 9311 / NRRL Y-6157 / RJB 2259-6 / UBC 559-6) TaxID=578456 RepID=UPI0003F4A0BB|nr:uncharacterized protein TREMEDRAFT_60625 [Tremella mesenterica DSM 1558]EIW71708.1 hypothetical protein TREMEDRAFT_60625 [Tremella mesenterica DSM 1558]
MVDRLTDLRDALVGLVPHHTAVHGLANEPSGGIDDGQREMFRTGIPHLAHVLRLTLIPELSRQLRSRHMTQGFTMAYHISVVTLMLQASLWSATNGCFPAKIRALFSEPPVHAKNLNTHISPRSVAEAMQAHASTYGNTSSWEIITTDLELSECDDDQSVRNVLGTGLTVYNVSQLIHDRIQQSSQAPMNYCCTRQKQRAFQVSIRQIPSDQFQDLVTWLHGDYTSRHPLPQLLIWQYKTDGRRTSANFTL